MRDLHGQIMNLRAENYPPTLQVDAGMAYRMGHRDARHDAAELAASLDAEMAALRKDAERYRWLRSTTNWASSNGERVDVRNNPELWDSAIDACIAKAAAVGAA